MGFRRLYSYQASRHWRSANLTLLIDGNVVASTNRTPNTPMAVRVMVSNDIWREGRGHDLIHDGNENVAKDEWIEIDYVHVFMTQKDHDDYDEEVSWVLSTAEATIEEAESRGLNTSRMETDLANTEKTWNETLYVPVHPLLDLTAFAQLLPEDLDEISSLFEQASEKIRRLEAQDPDSRVLRHLYADYARAEKAWEEYDFTLTKTSLRKIVEDIPEDS